MSTTKIMMKLSLHCGTNEIHFDLPMDCLVYKSNYENATDSPSEMLFESINSPVGSDPLNKLLPGRKEGNVVIVVSDITRPIPYTGFLPQLVGVIEQQGVARNEITILVATGMHRASTHEEHLKMFGNHIVENYRIIDHNCENDSELQLLDGTSWSGSKVRLNKHYVQAGFRIITGLVEPHFMAGFSGGRKAICPGIVALETLKKFHGYTFLNHPNAASTIMKDNPCNDENSSIARMCPPDFSINVVLDNKKKVNTIISGELFLSHQKAVEYVKKACCPKVDTEADLVITSSGGYPLDATFYQCVKGIVNCLPTVKNEGEIIAIGGCIEGIGSPEFTDLIKGYSGNYAQFLEDIRYEKIYVKDQWQFQMLNRALEKAGMHNLHFFTPNIPTDELSLLPFNPHSVSEVELTKTIQEKINEAIVLKKKIAFFPEGPYCSPTVNR